MKKRNRESWRKDWLVLINKLTSHDLQKLSWLDRLQENPHWSFVEFMCCYFDDCLLQKSYSEFISGGYVSQQEFDVLNEWHQLLDNYTAPDNKDDDHLAILNDPRWLQIIHAGEKAKEQLAVLLPEDERKFLTEKIDYKQKY